MERHVLRTASCKLQSVRVLEGSAGEGSLTRAARRESSWDTNDEAFARREFLGEVDLLTRRGLDEGNGGNGISFFDLLMKEGDQYNVTVCFLNGRKGSP